MPKAIHFWKEHFMKLHYNSPVVLSFSLASFLALILGLITENNTTLTLFAVYRSSLADPLAYLRLFLHVLGHSSYSHFMSNILMILVIGPTLEEKYGSKRLFRAIVSTAFVTGIFQMLFFDTALLGASGIVFMMIVLASYSGIRQGRIPLTLILVVLLYLGGEIADIFTNATDNVSQSAHILGGLCGIIVGIRYNRQERRRKQKAARRAQ